jgi:hypothetical protein
MAHLFLVCAPPCPRFRQASQINHARAPKDTHDSGRRYHARPCAHFGRRRGKSWGQAKSLPSLRGADGCLNSPPPARDSSACAGSQRAARSWRSWRALRPWEKSQHSKRPVTSKRTLPTCKKPSHASHMRTAHARPPLSPLRPFRQRAQEHPHCDSANARCFRQRCFGRRSIAEGETASPSARDPPSDPAVVQGSEFEGLGFRHHRGKRRAARPRGASGVGQRPRARS